MEPAKQPPEMLTSQEYRVLDHWRITPPSGFCYEEIDHVCHRIAREIERLERENQRLAKLVEAQKVEHRKTFAEVETLRHERRRLGVDPSGDNDSMFQVGPSPHDLDPNVLFRTDLYLPPGSHV